MDDQKVFLIKGRKTNITYMASPYYSRFLKTPDLQIGESSIGLTDLARNLGPFLSQDALITVVHVFVTPRIDHCNSLLYGIADYYINYLQRIQNGAARMVTNNGKI